MAGAGVPPCPRAGEGQVGGGADKPFADRRMGVVADIKGQGNDRDGEQARAAKDQTGCGLGKGRGGHRGRNRCAHARSMAELFAHLKPDLIAPRFGAYKLGLNAENQHRMALSLRFNHRIYDVQKGRLGYEKRLFGTDSFDRTPTSTFS